jgi:GNAT superfamily N-acetyltransferase
LQVEIVPFSKQHYHDLTAFWNQAYPELHRSELEMRLSDLASGAGKQRWMCEVKGIVVGFGGFEYLEGEQFHPRKHQLHLFVLPEHRRRGIGTLLYQRLLEALKLTDPLMVRVWAMQDGEGSSRFLRQRGFREEMQTFHSTLDVGSFDLARLEKYVTRIERNGYSVRSFGELKSDPERYQKCFELYCEVMRDIPSPESPLVTSLEEYVERIVKQPEFFRAQFLATLRGEYVGLCILLPKGRSGGELYADTLGVRRAYRGRGIAQALSHRGIEFAQSHGYTRISADSFVENERIQALIEWLGFGNRRVWTLFVKEFE